MTVSGGSAPLRVGLVACALTAALAGCSSSGLRSTGGEAAGDYGLLALLAAGESMQVGTALFCVEGNQSAQVSEVTLEHLDGIELVDYVVVTQHMGETILGTAAGPLGTDLPGRQDLTISGRCADVDEDFPDDGVDLSYVVLDLRLTEGREVGRARGVRVESDRGRAVDPMGFVLCDEALVPDCSSES